MNKLAPIILVIFSISLINKIHAQDWKYDFEEAQKIAKEKDQNIILLFTGSDWCVPCIKLERKILSNPEFKEFVNEKFVMVKADFPKRKKNKLPEYQEKKNIALAKRYNRRKVFPVILVINKDGLVLGATGYRKMSVERYIKLLSTFDSFGQ